MGLPRFGSGVAGLEFAPAGEMGVEWAKVRVWSGTGYSELTLLFSLSNFATVSILSAQPLFQSLLSSLVTLLSLAYMGVLANHTNQTTTQVPCYPPFCWHRCLPRPSTQSEAAIFAPSSPPASSTTKIKTKSEDRNKAQAGASAAPRGSSTSRVLATNGSPASAQASSLLPLSLEKKNTRNTRRANTDVISSPSSTSTSASASSSALAHARSSAQTGTPAPVPASVSAPTPALTPRMLQATNRQTCGVFKLVSNASTSHVRVPICDRTHSSTTKQ